jgi:hypothetical protein
MLLRQVRASDGEAGSVRQNAITSGCADFHRVKGNPRGVRALLRISLQNAESGGVMKSAAILIVALLGTSLFSQTTTAQYEGAVLNAREFPGEDIGAQVNTAAASCARESACHIVIPPSGPIKLTTPIVMTDGETVECSRSGYVGSGSRSVVAQINYEGAGVAVTMNGRGDSLLGCSLRLGASAASGVWMGGHSDYANQVTVSGGGTATTLVHISGRDTEDVHLEDSRLVDFVGIGVEIDHANDTFLTHITAYGVPRNETSRTLVIDSGAGGTNITDFVGGASGLHGLVVQNTLGRAAPTWIFAQNFQADCSTGSGWLFDSTLGSSMIGATFLNSWSSGAGGCGEKVVPGVAGIEVAGGVNIHIGGGSKIRANSGDGVLVDGKGVSNLQIEGDLITGNGYCKQCGAAAYSGIHITATAHTVQIVGNTLGNTFNANENQLYGVNVEAGVAGLIVANNLCDDNRGGCFNPDIARVESTLHHVESGNVTTTDKYSPGR